MITSIQNDYDHEVVFIYWCCTQSSKKLCHHQQQRQPSTPLLINTPPCQHPSLPTTIPTVYLLIYSINHNWITIQKNVHSTQSHHGSHSTHVLHISEPSFLMLGYIRICSIHRCIAQLHAHAVYCTHIHNVHNIYQTEPAYILAAIITVTIQYS